MISADRKNFFRKMLPDITLYGVYIFIFFLFLGDYHTAKILENQAKA